MRLAVAEALRNIWSARVVAVSLMLVASLTGAAVAVLTIAEVGRIALVTKQQEAAGAFAFQVVGPGGNRPSALGCEAIRALDGVVGAGGVMQTIPARFAIQPDVDLRVLSATPGFAEAAWVDLDGTRAAAVVVGSEFESLGLTRGSHVGYIGPDGTTKVIEVDLVADKAWMLGSERVLVFAAPPTGTVEACLVRASPEAASAVGDALVGWFGEGTSIQELLVRTSLMSDPQEFLSARISQYGWIAGSLVLAAILVGRWAARRAEFALYRLLGFRERALTLMFVVDLLVVCFLPAQLGATVAIGVSSPDTLTSSALLVDLLRLDVAMALIPLLGMLIFSNRSTIDALKGS